MKTRSFRDPARRAHRRSAVLIVTLAILTIMIVMLVAFVAIMSQDRGATQNYAQSLRAEQVAFGGLDQVVAQLQAEISDPDLSSNSTSSVSGAITNYIPKANLNAVPQPMANLSAGGFPTLVKISTNESFYTPAATTGANAGLASPSLSTTASLNGRSVSLARWNKPLLLPNTTTFPSACTPNWVLVTRNGPQSFTASQATLATLANASLSNTSYAVGRYAYAVYDTSGLIDINVAGNPLSSTSSNSGMLPFSDLTQLTNAVTASDVDNLIKWRNAASYTSYAAYTNYAANWSTNGFMQVAGGDTAFLGRQELIKYAQQTGNTDLTNALPYLTTFSRELNGPTYLPTTNYASPYNYLTLATADTGTAAVLNPFIMTARVKTGGWVRNNGSTAVVGEPLVKYRFPLDKLNLFNIPYASLTAQNKDDIARYFGLDPVTGDASSTYHHWSYPTTNSKYSHPGVNILTLNEVASLATPREPDFFELLQAGILQGSLAVSPVAPATTNARADYVTFSSATDPDIKKTYQLIRIGANIIDQWKSDYYPTVITYTPTSANFYGVEDLPYINQVFVKTYDEGTLASPGPWDYVIYYELWNPHQLSANPSPVVPTQFRVAPSNTSGSGRSPMLIGDMLAVQIRDGSSGGGCWYWSNTTQTWSTGTVTANNIPYVPLPPAGNTFTAQTTDFREPSLITASTASPYSTTYGGWTPSTPLSAVLIAQTTKIPLSNTSYSLTPWSTDVASQKWQVSFEFDMTLLLQYQDTAGWHTYATFEGNDDGKNYFYAGVNLGTTTSNQSKSVNAWALAKVDPRTPRFGPGFVVNGAATYPNSGAFDQTTTSQVQAKYRIGSEVPFLYTAGSSTAALPYRVDTWTVNQHNYGHIQGANVGTDPSYSDLDGVTRGGDATYSYWPNGQTPLLPAGANGNPARPIILHRPFQSVGELGYVFRDDPWRTLDLFTPNSPDAGLLDLFTLSDAPIIAGRVNPNTPYPNVLAALVSGAPLTNSATATIPSTAVSTIANAITNVTTTTPFMNRAALVTTLMTNSTVTTALNTGIKTQRESVVRALAESANTRTWNFLIDIVAQSGNYPPTASNTSLDNFVVTGERRYWLHVAIDRYTGQVVDKQLEVVNE